MRQFISHEKWLHNRAGKKLIQRNKKFKNIKLAYYDLTFATLEKCDFQGANLSHADLSFTKLGGSNFNRAILQRCVLIGANLEEADLSYTDLTNADLTFANLYCADLSFANLNGAKLSGANLEGVNIAQTYGLPDENDYFNNFIVEDGKLYAYAHFYRDIAPDTVIYDDISFDRRILTSGRIQLSYFDFFVDKNNLYQCVVSPENACVPYATTGYFRASEILVKRRV